MGDHILEEVAKKRILKLIKFKFLPYLLGANTYHDLKTIVLRVYHPNKFK